MKNKVIFIGLLMFLFSLTIVSAVSFNLGPKVKILDEQNRVLNPEDINKEKQLAFEVTFTNEMNYWLCSNYWSASLKISKEGDDANKARNLNWYYNNDDNKFCLAPNEEFSIWLIFEEYNELEKDKRIGNWKINPTISLGNNPNYYLTSDISKRNRAEVEKQGNIIDFTITKDDPSTNPGMKDFREGFEWFWDYWILWIGGGIVILIVIGGAIVKAFK